MNIKMNSETNSFLDKKVKEDLVFLAGELMESLMNYRNEYKISEIRNIDNFKKYLERSINSLWKTELSDKEKSYYYQGLDRFKLTKYQQQDYINKLFHYSVEEVLNIFLDYVDKHENITKIVLRKPDLSKWLNCNS